MMVAPPENHGESTVRPEIVDDFIRALAQGLDPATAFEPPPESETSALQGARRQWLAFSRSKAGLLLRRWMSRLFPPHLD